MIFTAINSSEFQKSKPEHLFINAGDQYQKKCIICPDPNGFNKVYADINLMLTRGHTIRQEIVNKKFDIGLVEYKAQWSISIIGIADGKKGRDLNHPAMIKVPVKSNLGLIGQALSAVIGHKYYEPVPNFRNRITFERLKPRLVDIPFASQLFESLLAAGGDHIDIKMMILAKMISICSIINQPEPVTKEEIGSYIYKTDIQNVRKWLVKGSDNEAGINTEVPLVNPLTAMKVDYYIASLLLDGLLTSGNNYLTERQKRIYESVCRINMEKVKQAMLKKGDEIELLSTISQSSVYWARRENIYELVNSDGGQYLSLSIVNNELIELMKMGIIERSKPQKSRHFKYYVVTLNYGGAISLPHPSEIDDPVYEGKPVDVINPLTGQTEKI